MKELKNLDAIRELLASHPFTLMITPMVFTLTRITLIQSIQST